MAGATLIPTTKHHNLNPQPIPEDPTKFHYHFLCKAVIVAIFLLTLPLFPSQAPQFIHQSLLTKNWELLHLLLAGIAISYGLFSRRNDQTQKENNNSSRFDTAHSYLSRFLQVFEDDAETPSSPSSDESKIQTWSSYQYHRNEPVVVVASKLSNFCHQSAATSSRICEEKPLLLPVRSLKSRVSDEFDTSSVQSDNESSASSVSGGRFSRSGGETEDNNVVLPSPIPWRSESSKLEPRSLVKSQTLRSCRSNSMAASSSSPSESAAKNAEDVMMKKKKKGFHQFHKSSPPPPPPPPPPMLFKSISMKATTSSSFHQGASFDKEMKRSFTGERKGSNSMGFDEDTETEDDDDEDEDDDDDVAESSRSDGNGGCSSSSSSVVVVAVGEEGVGPDVDKKADEFIAKFREQIRLQRIDSIKRSAARITRNSSRLHQIEDTYRKETILL